MDEPDKPTKQQQLTFTVEKHQQNKEIIDRFCVGNLQSYSNMLTEANIWVTTDLFAEILKS